MEFPMYRPFLALAGLLGALGVATAAAASHGGDTNLGIVANFLLFHAPALIGLSLVPRTRLVTVAGYLLVVALAVFCGDLAARSLVGHALFPMAAPIGGGGLILGWLLVAALALFTRRS
jgi:uncharacterized membrane protein YgdD (TMEM256/DUF423 family)